MSSSPPPNTATISDQDKKQNRYVYKGGDVPEEVKKNVVHVDVDETVTTIDEFAFSQCKSLKSIHLPDGLEFIDDEAFVGCESLKSLHLPYGLKRIGCLAFSDCQSLTSIRFPDGLKKIDIQAFSGCKSLTSIHLPDALKRMGDAAFEGCTSLTSVRLPSGLVWIGDAAFSGCAKLVVIEVPSDTTIGDDLFEGCEALCRDGLDNNHDWLKSRFDDLPLHRACYQSNEQDIKDALLTHKNTAAREMDAINLTPLHILAINPNATKGMVKAVVEQCSDAITNTDNVLGMSPLHFASINPGEHVIDFLPYLKNRVEEEIRMPLEEVQDKNTTTTGNESANEIEDADENHVDEERPVNFT